MMYNSPRFCVVQYIGIAPSLPIGVEIVDKTLCRECYISGEAAKIFFRRMEELVTRAATVEEVDDVLGEYLPLFTHPLILQ